MESSIEGREFYERFGFVGKEVAVVEAGVDGWGVQESVWMVWKGEGDKKTKKS